MPAHEDISIEYGQIAVSHRQKEVLPVRHRDMFVCIGRKIVEETGMGECEKAAALSAHKLFLYV
jgi:hypothetical protein